MSLAEQSQQWFPTSVQVTVHQARNLRIKGKNGTNDAYAIIQVAKDKFSTSVAEKSVAPVWKEEASFDLPLFHPGNAERCTLYIIVMHRAQVGLDKFLGQAVVNLLDLHDSSSRKKTDWFKLVDKTGKEDKARGEVLLDIQFLRNNLSASMFDLSMQDKPRSRISKLKDKVRGKKKDGFSDSASAIVPSVSQVLTDSEGEADAKSLSHSPEVKKKSKLKTLFAPKSNLQRNISQSMSTLGTLPEKNSSLSGSRSSGLNVDSPEAGKKKFKFLGHKRTSSTDSKVSQGPFSLLGRSKHSSNDLNNLCINGSHVYAEEAEPKTGSTLSLNSSGQGSVEDVRRHNSDVSADSLKGLSVPSYRRESTDRALLEQQRHQEEEERRQAEEKRRADAKRLEEEEKSRAEAKRLQEEEERKYQEEQERRRRFLEDEARRNKLKEEEEERRKQEEERRMLEEAENRRLEEERHRLEEQQRQEEVQRAEEQKRQEEASMSDRLSSLFGMIRKKEEKKEDVQQQSGNGEELPRATPHHVSEDVEVPISHSTNPFEEISLSSDPQNSSDELPVDHQKPVRNPQTPSAMVFLNRTAKVSAVKPRLAESLKPAHSDCQTHSQQCPPSPATSESTLSSVPSESPVIFSELHSSLAPPRIRHSSSESPRGSTENLSSVGSSPTMSETKRRAPVPPNYAAHGFNSGLSSHIESPSRNSDLVTIREIENPAYVEADGSQNYKRPALPLPDYESLYPQKRHGVQGYTRWDHIIAEVNQRQRDNPPHTLSQEMSVDGPEEPAPTRRSSLMQERPAVHSHQTQHQEAKPVSTKKIPAPLPPKPVATTHPQSVAASNQNQSRSFTQTHSFVERPNRSAVQRSVNSTTSSSEAQSVMSKDEGRKVLPPSHAATDHILPTEAPRPTSQTSWDKTPPPSDQKEVLVLTKEVPTARPRQKALGKESMKQEDPDAAVVVATQNTNSDNQALHSLAVNNTDKRFREVNEKVAEFDPFPNAVLLAKDPWAQLEQNQGVDDCFTGKVQTEKKLEDQGMTANDLDKLFMPDHPIDPFSSLYGSDSGSHPEHKKKNTDSSYQSPAFQRKNSQRRKQLLLSLGHSDNKDTKSHQEPKPKEETTLTTANHSLSSKEVWTESITSPSFTQHPQIDVKTQRTLDGGERVETQFKEDPFGADPFIVPSSSPSQTTTEPLRVAMEESASQAGGLSGGKTPLRAWVLPSDLNAQNSNGGGLASLSRRPHPVKPMSSVENQHPTSSPAVREIKAYDGTTGKTKADSGESGPYTQLTQEELITLVVKQQTELSKKDAKIVELEDYIDNLLVRVIEEKPSILLTLSSGKPV
ncbi:rab11 family-interacting protein 1 isoform X3 [Myripristis murdjan]|uniref:rab11 family-interacting protein 1 isoform X3 n=1 Tax=Myripristis murdjan TaxID=586833 RepID=UPI0011760A2E|nr:rab11 family-interacting protein 1-like isoform X3 [Myripristis murdjan]